METQQKSNLLVHCRQLIEEKVNWGHSAGWSTQHFERLSEEIAGQTGVVLSVTTLKRMWGRVKYDSTPTATTLNVLAQFLNYPNWYDFQRSQPDSFQSEMPESQALPTPAQPEQQPLTRKDTPRNHRWMGAGLIVVLLLVLVIFLNYSPKQLVPEDFIFSSRPVVKGIPNSVVFNYDATASPTDSIFIQQSWDPTRRQLVPKNGHQYTSLYYYPGYYRAKLVVGQQIVREHDLVIPSAGWVSAVHQKSVPVYFPQAETIANGVLQLPLEVIQRKNIPLQPKLPLVIFSHVGAIKNLMTDNFVFETRLENSFSQGSGVCQKAGISFVCRNDRFVIPLAAKGCVGELSLLLGGHQAKSTNADLSAFGQNMSQWLTLRCETVRKHIKIFINDTKVYEADMPNAPAEILGINYFFEGTGSVDYTRFTRLNGDLVFEDTFDEIR